MVVMPLPRALREPIEALAFHAGKMAFVAGPRQCGKTTLAKTMLADRGAAARYASWDDVETRRSWAKNPKLLLPGPSRSRPLLALDEIHKLRGWKRDLKGVYDTLERRVDILVTGSARLDVFRRGGDSLLGRYLLFRLHPLSVREVAGRAPRDPATLPRALAQRAEPFQRADAAAFDQLLRFGGFPEPFFAADERRGLLWRRHRVERVIREDLRDLTRIPELGRIEMLAALLPERVGSPLSVQSLREDLEVAHDTATRWLENLKELYYAFELKPYARSIRRSLRKEGKLYLWDWSEVDASGPRLENLIACHLLKACDYWTDTGEGRFNLHYLRDKEKREVDFLVTADNVPLVAIEAKVSDEQPSPSWETFMRQLGPAVTAIQIVAKPGVWRWHGLAAGRVLVASAAEVLGYFA